MKLLGHAWVAVNAYPRGDRQLLSLGSILPEIMYYTQNHPFKFAEIHEGGDVVYKYLMDKFPRLADLGIGMLSHSAKAGADRYNMDENLELLGYAGDEVDKLRFRLTDILSISYDTAKIRAHNILELAIDLKIIQKHPEFVSEFSQAVVKRDIIKQVIKILSRCFQKPVEAVANSVNELLAKVKPVYLRDAVGLSDLWVELSRQYDPVPDKKRLAELLQELSTGYGDKSEVFLCECISWTKGNLGKYLQIV